MDIYNVNLIGTGLLSGSLGEDTTQSNFTGSYFGNLTGSILLNNGTSSTGGSQGYISESAVFYNTPSNNQTGISPTVYFIRTATTYNLTNQTGSQQLFESGSLSLPAGTYYFTSVFRITQMSTASGNASFNIGGSGGTNYLMNVIGFDQNPTSGPTNVQSGFSIINTFATPNMVTAGASNAMAVTMVGTFELTSSGTIIPQINLSASSAFTNPLVTVGSFFRIESMGPNGITSVGGWV